MTLHLEFLSTLLFSFLVLKTDGVHDVKKLETTGSDTIFNMMVLSTIEGGMEKRPRGKRRNILDIVKCDFCN